MKKVLIILISMLSCNFCLAQDILELKSEAKRGDATAMNRLGVIYHGGKGVTQDYGEAMKWYKIADEKGNIYAPENIGILYYNGNGVTQSYEEALKWYKKAADRGNASAMNRIGVLYYDGKGISQDY